jgi:hypothetical protein
MNFMEQWLRPCTREERVRAKKKKKKKKEKKKKSGHGGGAHQTGRRIKDKNEGSCLVVLRKGKNESSFRFFSVLGGVWALQFFSGHRVIGF